MPSQRTIKTIIDISIHLGCLRCNVYIYTNNSHCIIISTWAYLEIIARLSNKFNSNVTFLTKGFKFQMFFEVKTEHFRALLWHSKCSEIMGWYCWTCFNRSHLCAFIFCRRDDAVEVNWWHWIFFTFKSFPSIFISVHVCDCLFRRGLLGCNVSRCFVLYFFFRFCRCLCLCFLDVGSVMITLWWIIAGIETWALA